MTIETIDALLESYRDRLMERQQVQELRDSLLEKYDEILADRAAELLAVEEAIDCLDDPQLRTLLRYHYIDGLDWEEVGERMYYSGRWIYSLRDKAISKIKAKEPGA